MITIGVLMVIAWGVGICIVIEAPVPTKLTPLASAKAILSSEIIFNKIIIFFILFLSIFWHDNKM